MLNTFNNFLLEDFKKAIAKLEEVLNLEKNEIVRDSALKRFELCFDLAWKSIKLIAQREGVECYSPRECFRAGFQLKLLEHSEEWMAMLEDRNKIVHIYREEYADQVYKKLPKYLNFFEGLLGKIQEKAGS